jgi:hypothetical protein
LKAQGALLLQRRMLRLRQYDFLRILEGAWIPEKNE